MWPYVEESSYTEVDALAKKVAAPLNMQLITDETGDAITCVSDGMLEDVADTEWQALTRCVNFYVLALQPSEVQGPLANDPWIDALVSWTQAILGNGYDVRGGQLPVGYKRPAVLWRLDNIQIEDCGSLAFDVVKGVACHVFGRNAVEEANVAVQLIEEMGNAVKLPISAAERRYMTIRDIKGNVYTDALKQGHIRATVARRTRRPRRCGAFFVRGCSKPVQGLYAVADRAIRFWKEKGIIEKDVTAADFVTDKYVVEGAK